jgi:hypothetical protein
MNLFVQMSGVSRIWVGFNILLMTTRFLKALHFQGRMGLVTRTFANALNDIAHFSVIFIFILVMYAIMGQFMFGAQLNSFRELGSSMMMLFTTTLTVGVEDYNSMLSVAPYMAPITTIFWLSFLIISTVVLLNIFLAILVEGFSVVKETAQDSETLVEGFAEIFAHDVRAWWEPPEPQEKPQPTRPEHASPSLRNSFHRMVLNTPSTSLCSIDTILNAGARDSIDPGGKPSSTIRSSECVCREIARAISPTTESQNCSRHGCGI